MASDETTPIIHVTPSSTSIAPPTQPENIPPVPIFNRCRFSRIWFHAMACLFWFICILLGVGRYGLSFIILGGVGILFHLPAYIIWKSEFRLTFCLTPLGHPYSIRETVFLFQFLPFLGGLLCGFLLLQSPDLRINFILILGLAFLFFALLFLLVFGCGADSDEMILDHGVSFLGTCVCFLAFLSMMIPVSVARAPSLPLCVPANRSSDVVLFAPVWNCWGVISLASATQASAVERFVGPVNDTAIVVYPLPEPCLQMEATRCCWHNSRACIQSQVSVCSSDSALCQGMSQATAVKWEDYLFGKVVTVKVDALNAVIASLLVSVVGLVGFWDWHRNIGRTDATQPSAELMQFERID